MSTSPPVRPAHPLVNAIENSVNGVLLTDCSGTIEWANPAFTALTGYSRSEVIGNNPGTWNSGWHPPSFFPEVWETLLAGRPWNGQIRSRRKDGSLYTEEIAITPIQDAGGVISHFLVIQQEMAMRLESEPGARRDTRYGGPAADTGRGRFDSSQLEAQLRRAQKMEAVGQLAGGAAHDFNNLLTVINGYSDLLLSRKEPVENTDKYIRLIRDAGERAATLAARMLAFSRPKAEESAILNLNDIVTGMSTLLRRLLPVNIEFTHKLEPRLDAVMADAGLMEQVLMNLVVNARDAMPEGGGLGMETANVTLDAASATAHGGLPPGRYVALTITDTGVGMDESTREHLFEPFYTTKPAGVGTGLGLSTVYRIVKQSAGWISIQSEKGKGTKVSVYLPGAQGEAAPEVRPPRIVPERGSGTILVVDDNAEVLRFTAKVLEGLGYTILPASSGQEAENWARSFAARIDIVVIDLVLPDGNGRDIAARLRAIRPGLVVLFVSGYALHTAFAEGVLPPGSGFLPKPFRADALGLSVQQALRKRRQRILVIDDDPAVLEFARLALSDAGLDVLAARNGSGAAALVRDHGIDLVITDLIMPESEGLETIRDLRRAYPALPIIAMSGAFGGQFLKHALGFGVQAAIHKPFSAADLMEVVRRTLGIGARHAGN